MVLAEEKRNIKNTLEVQSDLFSMDANELGMKYGSFEGSINFIDGLSDLINRVSYSFYIDNLGDKLRRTFRASWINTVIDPTMDVKTQERIEFECQYISYFLKRNESMKTAANAFHVELRDQYEAIRCDIYGISSNTDSLVTLLLAMPDLFEAITEGKDQVADAMYASGVAYLANNYPKFMDSLDEGIKENINRIIGRKTIKETSNFFGTEENRARRIAARKARREIREIPKKLKSDVTKKMS